MHVRTPAIILIIPPATLIDASISGNILTINPVVDMIVPNTPWLVALSFIISPLYFQNANPIGICAFRILRVSLQIMFLAQL